MTLAGPSVLDIVQHYVERWNEIKKRKVLSPFFNLRGSSLIAFLQYRNDEYAPKFFPTFSSLTGVYKSLHLAGPSA